MSLNIKNEDVHAAVRELAHKLGVSQTSAVALAVRAKLDEVDNRDARARRSHNLRAAAAAALGFDAEPADLGLIVASTLWPCTMTELQTLRRGSAAARRLKVQLRNLDAAKDAATLFHRVERDVFGADLQQSRQQASAGGDHDRAMAATHQRVGDFQR